MTEAIRNRGIFAVTSWSKRKIISILSTKILGMLLITSIRGRAELLRLPRGYRLGLTGTECTSCNPRNQVPCRLANCRVRPWICSMVAFSDASPASIAITSRYPIACAATSQSGSSGRLQGR